MNRYILIPNWEKFQHKDVWRKNGGSPRWIKNYTQLLHRDEYLDLSLSQRGLLHGLWLLYASSGQALRHDRARQLLCTNQGESSHYAANLEALSDAGFIEISSRPEEKREEEIRKTQARGFEHVSNPRQALHVLNGGNEEVA